MQNLIIFTEQGEQVRIWMLQCICSNMQINIWGYIQIYIYSYIKIYICIYIQFDIYNDM